jgi:hypothetical protein
VECVGGVVVLNLFLFSFYSSFNSFWHEFFATGEINSSNQYDGL